MATSDSGLADVTQVQAQPEPKLIQRPPRYRNPKHRSRLLKVSSLPPHLLNECIKRMHRGVPISKIAEWLLKHEERGGLNGVQTYASMRQYLGALALELAERHHPEPTVEDAHARLISDLESQGIVPVMIPKPGKRGKYMPISEYLDQRCADDDEELYLRAFLHLIYEALQRNREVEESYGDKHLPTQPFAPAMAQLIQQGVHVAEELRKRLDSAVERKKIIVGIGEHVTELFEGRRSVDSRALHKAIQQAIEVVLHDTVVSLQRANQQAPPQLPQAESEAPGPYAELPAIERLFVRSYIEKDLALLKLQLEEEAEKQSGEHTVQPDPPASIP